MTGDQLARHRRHNGRTQPQTARALGVSQTYLSLLEAGKRPVTEVLHKKAVRVFGLPPTQLPADLEMPDVPTATDEQLTADLAALGYKGFAHLRRSRLRNPAVVLLAALNAEKRDARVVEALPWVVLTFPEIAWKRLFRMAKAYDLQNRLGYVVCLARQVAERRGDTAAAMKLERHEMELYRSLLVREETLCNETMTNAERRWLATNRPEQAKRWHLLTDLAPQTLGYYDD
ncbi:MAG: helix-turn-helix transcriptional regulator [Pyrinomonadaceae bacterium]|nr:helix-turn-helix transcriptional regulator [Pyrinomonadaceae bacterium]MBP6213689.1 helix-turn-helix transcriptional regulator [Pyrinomonadaceae bacterium]